VYGGVLYRGFVDVLDHTYCSIKFVRILNAHVHDEGTFFAPFIMTQVDVRVDTRGRLRFYSRMRKKGLLFLINFKLQIR
jgi:hypothetical protein